VSASGIINDDRYKIVHNLEAENMNSESKLVHLAEPCMENLEFHAYANLFPMMSGEALVGLKKDIAAKSQ